MSCSTCHGAPVRAVRRGHDVVFRACDRADAERGGCPDCLDTWELPLVCSGCERPLGDSPFTVGVDERYCDLCAVALCSHVVGAPSVSFGGDI